jgi:pantothenate kinase
MVTLTDVIILTGSGLVGGICIGLLIRNKQINDLKYQIDAADGSYTRLLDLYMEKFYAQSLEKARVNVAKKKAGRPKGSTNKPKDNGRPTTRKYTRKSSK